MSSAAISLITAMTILSHSLFGCCWHHRHEEGTACRHHVAVESTATKPHCDHHHHEHELVADADHERGSHESQCPCDHRDDCGESDCVFVQTNSKTADIVLLEYDLLAQPVIVTLSNVVSISGVATSAVVSDSFLSPRDRCALTQSWQL